MENRNEKEGLSRIRWGGQLESLAIVILAFYPLRHIGLGLDLWDTGYNYANFQYMGTEHMDPMWLFSTYLANALGNLLTKLPRADTLAGMNLYTGLLASALALIGYFFFTRKLKMPKVIAFAGEMTALSLCWCPTALLYNYLTYLLFLLSSVFLYLGLTIEEERSGKKRGYLICAGALLGTNVLVRFSNLPEAGMILAVWAYDFILWLEERRNSGKRHEEKSGLPLSRDSRLGFWRRTIRHTLWCLAGYVSALAVLFCHIHIRYGFGEYVKGIGRLFAMTDMAVDYKPKAMVMGLIGRYIEEMYWAARIGVIIAGGMALFALAEWLEGHLSAKASGVPAEAGKGKDAGRGKENAEKLKTEELKAEEWRAGKRRAEGLKAEEMRAMPASARGVHLAVRALWIAVSIAMIVWLCKRGFVSAYYFSYDSIWHPGPIFLMLAMLIAGIRILDRNVLKEEKLISGMVVLIILLTPIGSNNDVRPSLNNLFLAAPYVLWESWRFLRYAGKYRTKIGLVLSAFPAKSVLGALLALCLYQFGAFGAFFTFAEGTGIQHAEVAIDNNAVLRNIKMSPQRAEWMRELSDYANEAGLQGREVILYGKIPALSYYLQMPSAFNPWSDLKSYSAEVMESELAKLAEEIEEQGLEKPVVILENTYALHLEENSGDGAGSGGNAENPGSAGESGNAENPDSAGESGNAENPGSAEESGNAENPDSAGESGNAENPDSAGEFDNAEETQQKLEADGKWKLLTEFMDAFGYEQTFRNEKFAVYR